MTRNSFILYQSQCEIVANLDDDIRLKLFDSIINFAFKDEIPEKNDKLFFALFSIFKDQIERDSLKYAEKCIKRAEAGKKGGLAKASNTKQHLANLADNENVNYNENENDNDNVNDNVNEINILPVSEKKEVKPKPEKKPKDYPKDFETFWREYLSKTKRAIGSKPNSLTQCKKLSEIERKLSLDRLSEYQTTSGMGEFMKDAERYLKGKIWESYDSVVQLEFGIPVNSKTGNANGRNLPDKKTWEEFKLFCEQHPHKWMSGLDLKKAYTEVPFDCWGKAYLIDFLIKFVEQEKEGK